MLECSHCVLLVIDIQDKLMSRDPAVAETLVDNAGKLIRSAQTLAIPLLVTEQNPARLGGTTERLCEILGDLPRIPKMEFGCLANAAFAETLRGLGRKQLLVTGMETHICVMQTVLAALDAGFDTYVVRDAVSSSAQREYEAGLDRMAGAGAKLVTTQMVLFELLRAAGTPEFRAMLPLLK